MPAVAKKILLYGVLPGVMLVSLTASIGTTYAQGYMGKIFPGVTIGPVDVGGLTHEEAAAKLAIATNAAIKNGLTVIVGDATKTIPLLNEGVNDPDASIELVSWNIDEAVETALSVGRDNAFTEIVAPLLTRFSGTSLDAKPSIDRERLMAALSSAFPEANHGATEPVFIIKKIDGAWTVLVEGGVPGPFVDYDQLLREMDENLSSELFLPTIALTITTRQPLVGQTAAEELADEVVAIMQAAPYTLHYTDDYGEHAWTLDAEIMTSALAPTTRDGAVAVGFTAEFPDTLGALTADVLTPAQDAKLVIEDGKVKEFRASKTGAELSMEETLLAIAAVWGQADQTIELVVTTTAPDINVGEVNDLGIKEILGVGTSKFLGSPTNRIKNIKNGARLLNGTLVKPGETFSLLNTLKPFTTDNGYLPELVIKGDKIQPELGGGLCQIGTTIFRATMNSGMPIVERRNHSLAVSYYNDPVNGNPGTDATIYEPSPDFKFLNDTGFYILIATDVNTATGQLTFTFWGTSDGRQGSYSAPVVSSWIPAGATKNIETLDLAPGEKKCQHAYPGANASFTYTIKRSENEIEEQIFTSSYRALPEICLVGVAELTPVAEEAETVDVDLVPTDESSKN